MKFTIKVPIIIFGAGKISWSLVPALQLAGYKINTVISRVKKNAEKLANTFDIKSYSDELNSIKLKRCIFILAVPDNQVKSVGKKLSEKNFDFPASLFIHLSGSQDVSLLNALHEKGAYTASFHIMQTFPSKKTRDIKNSFSAVESVSDTACNYLFKLSKDLKLNPFRINSADKVIYHLAGVYASNFINAVIYQSRKLAGMLNLEDYSFNDIFAPLFLSTIRNIKKSGPVQALSGPVERGDPDTIKKHINALKKSADRNRDILLSYLSLSLILVQAAEEKSGSLNKGQTEIKQLLEKELSLL
jgi:predicted short-subunit dehydrogenase-like oxidoreductase (DUF2520 family)